MRTLKQLQEAIKDTDCKVVKYNDGRIYVFMGKEQRYTHFEVPTVKRAIEAFKNRGIIA